MVPAVVMPPVNTANGPLEPSRRRHLPLALLLALFATVVTSHASTRWATLEAIHKIENPYNLTKPGPRGELGAYQFRASTWRMHTNVPFHHALDRSTSDTIAIKHYEWLKRGLERARIPANTYNIALAWNGGLSAVIRGKSPRVAHNYAQRAVNLASTLAANAKARTPLTPAPTFAPLLAQAR